VPIKLNICFFSNESLEQLQKEQYSIQDINILTDLGHQVTIATSFREVPFGCDLYFSWWASGSIFPLIKARLSGRPIIVVAGGNEAVFYRDSVTSAPLGYLAAPWYKKLATRLCLRLANRVLVVSKFMTKDVKTLGAKNPILVPNSVDTTLFKKASGSRHFVTSIFNLDEDVVRIKRGENFIRSIPHVIQTFPEAKFIIIGRKGNAFNRLAALAKDLGIDQHLDFIGNIENTLVAHWMQSSLAYVQISDTETFGVAIAEAMSCGVPVVVSYRGAIPDLVGDDGIYVDQNNPASVAEGICTALSAGMETEGGLETRSRDRIERYYSYESRKQKIADIISDLFPYAPRH